MLRKSVDPTQDLQNQLAEMKALFEKKFDKREEAAVEQVLKSKVGDTSLTNGSHTPLPDTPNESVTKVLNESTPRFLKVNPPCHLAVVDVHSKNLVVVADGTICPYNPSSPLIHNGKPLDDYYRVSLDNPYPEHVEVMLPCQSKDGETTKVGQVKGHFLEWPIDQVVFRDDEEVLLRDGVQPQGDGSLKEASSKGNNITKSVIGNSASQMKIDVQKNVNPLQVLGEDCQTLSLMVKSMLDCEFSSVQITIPSTLFYYNEQGCTTIAKTNIDKLVNGDRLNIPIIQVYQKFLIEEFPTYFENSLVSFHCPVRLCNEEVGSQPLMIRDYIRDAFMAEKKKKDKQCKFILAPYRKGNHWILLVVELEAGKVFVFDPRVKPSDKFRKFKIYSFTNLAILGHALAFY